MSVISRSAVMPWRRSGERAFDEAGDRRGPSRRRGARRRRAGVVVDDRVDVVVADPGLGAHPVARALRAVAGHSVAGAQEAGVAACVHVQQVAGAGPLVRLAGSLTAAAGARCRARRSTFQPSSARSRSRRRPAAAPSRSAPAGADRTPASSARELTRRAVRPDRAIEQHDGGRRASSLASSQRCHQRCAVAGETLKAAAAAFSDRPCSIARTSASRPASPSLALACGYIRARRGSSTAAARAGRISARSASSGLLRASRADVQAGGGLLGDRPLAAARADLELARRGLRLGTRRACRGRSLRRRTSAAGRRRARRAARSSRRAPGSSSASDTSSRFSACSTSDRPASRAGSGRVAEPLVDPLDHVLRERVAELVRVHVRLGGGVAHEVGEKPLDQPVLADDSLGALDARSR